MAWGAGTAQSAQIYVLLPPPAAKKASIRTNKVSAYSSLPGLAATAALSAEAGYRQVRAYLFYLCNSYRSAENALDFWDQIASSPVGSLFHTVLLDNLDDAFSVRNGAKNFSGSIATCLQSVGQPMPLDRGAIHVLEVGTIVEALHQHLGGTYDYALHCPRAAPSVEVVACTYHHWFGPFSQHRWYCRLPVSSRRMQRFLQFTLGSHQLPIVLGRFAGVVRASRVCTHCGSVAVADELHMVFECPALQAVITN